MLGETVEAVWFNMWGVYIVPERAAMHSDDMQLKPKDVEIVTDLKQRA